LARRQRAGRSLQRLLRSALLCFLTAGCSVNPPLDLDRLTGGEPGPRLADVPFYPQTDYQCGPAALAGLLGAAGVTTTPAELSPQVYLPGRQGTLQVELLAATRRAGRIPWVIDGTPEALLAQLQAQRPVLVLQNLRTPHFPLWHYALVTGVDAPSNTILLNSGTERSLALAAPSFLRSWDWAGRWGMVALRPGAPPPPGADAQAWGEAVAAFEAVAGAAAARPAWVAAARRWPDSPLPWLALGNQAYAAGAAGIAARCYAAGLARDAGAPALANNLGSVLGETGCPRTAAALLRPVLAALPAGSAWRPVLEGTLAELVKNSGADAAECVVWLDLRSVPQPAVQGPGPRGLHGKQEQSPGHGDVLEEHDELCLVGQVGMEQGGGDHAEPGQQQGHQAGPVAEHQGDAAQ